MADETPNTASPEVTEAATAWTAELVNGNVYVYGNKFFYKGKPEPVSAEVKAALEVDAVYPATVSAGEDATVEYRQKFVFTPIATSPAARSRTRA